MAVNVSPRGLLAAGFVEVVTALLAETGTPPSRLTLEITESSVMADPGQAERVLHELHDARRPPVGRRLRHRLLLAGLPAAAAGATR